MSKDNYDIYTETKENLINIQSILLNKVQEGVYQDWFNNKLLGYIQDIQNVVEIINNIKTKV